MQEKDVVCVILLCLKGLTLYNELGGYEKMFMVSVLLGFVYKWAWGLVLMGFVYKWAWEIPEPIHKYWKTSSL